MEYINLLANKVELVEVKSANILKEWNDKQQEIVSNKLMELFHNKTVYDHHNKKYFINTLEKLELFLGLPYTSSSQYAMLGITNTLFKIDIDNQFNLEYICMDDNNNVLMVAMDRDQQEVFLKIV